MKAHCSHARRDRHKHRYSIRVDLWKQVWVPTGFQLYQPHRHTEREPTLVFYKHTRSWQGLAAAQHLHCWNRAPVFQDEGRHRTSVLAEVHDVLMTWNSDPGSLSRSIKRTSPSYHVFEVRVQLFLPHVEDRLWGR